MTTVAHVSAPHKPMFKWIWCLMFSDLPKSTHTLFSFHLSASLPMFMVTWPPDPHCLSSAHLNKEVTALNDTRTLGV